ncbi:Zn-ribbon domain-containing OB-fold protein [Haloplanus pelagicus]|jgi:uncharacterized OB-fold protein|uniref:Zn-ribbon domain-containing OB-fold protein n=1 Tax=Haloplanus pelagicus TaxID=2949995 RepID=UPI00203BADFA|nr:Zn-ribbon domain-containing OB-fold protein [Haloplanus sp. HW8-1]
MTDDTSPPTAPRTAADVTADSPFTLPGFFAALADGDLLAAVCRDCGAHLIPPRPACYACGGRTLRAESQPLTGDVITYTEVRTPPPALEARAPYTVAIVELDSGARLTGRLTVPHADAAIGMRVRLTTRPPDDDELAMALDNERDWPIHEFDPIAADD